MSRKVGKNGDSSLTRLALSDAMKNLLSERPLSDIRIADITDACHLSRKSFYYHFKDKEDLIQWIFDSEFMFTLDFDHVHAPVDYWRALMRYLYDNRAFYANALEASGQNCFADYFSSRMRRILVEHYRGQLGEQPYADEFSEGLVDGIVMFITRWLQEWPHIEPDRLIELLQEGLVKLSKYILSEQAGGAAETR